MGGYQPGSVYYYAPNKVAPIVFAVLFTISGVVHFYQTMYVLDLHDSHARLTLWKAMEVMENHRSNALGRFASNSRFHYARDWSLQLHQYPHPYLYTSLGYVWTSSIRWYQLQHSLAHPILRAVLLSPPSGASTDDLYHP